MALVFDGPVIPDDLTEYVRTIPVPAEFVLDQILPNDYIDSNQIDVGELTQTNRTARFRAYDAQLHRAQRDTGNLRTVTLPPLSDTLSVGELERLKMQFARVGGTNENAIVNAIYDDGTNLTRNVQNRMELARGDVLADGKFTLAGEGGLFLEADFGVPAGNFVTAEVLHDHQDAGGSYDADVIGDISAWVKSYVKVNGFKPGGMWITQDILTAWLSNGPMRQAAGSILGPAMFLTVDQFNQILAARQLPPILGVYDALVDVDGAPTRILPNSGVTFVPPVSNPLGRTVWGISATALEIVNDSRADLSFEQAAGIVGAVDKSDAPPYREMTFVDAVGMPIIDRPRTLMVATVLSEDEED